jgi:hypothetical protein
VAKQSRAESVPEYDGSVPLKNATYERFAQEVVALNSEKLAYERVGYKRPRGNADRLAAKPKVAKRIAYLWQQAADLAELAAARHLVKADLVAHANILDFFDIDEHGRPRLNLNKAEHALAGAIQEISFDANGYPKLKLHDAVGMLKFLIDRQSPAPRRVELTGKDGAPLIPEQQAMPEIEMAKRVAFLLATGQQRLLERPK